MWHDEKCQMGARIRRPAPGFRCRDGRWKVAAVGRGLLGVLGVMSDPPGVMAGRCSASIRMRKLIVTAER